MAGNTFGTLFKIATFGESHGGAVGAVVDGCPPGLEISEAEIQAELDRRHPGQSAITTPRKEQDVIHILAGVFEGKTTGTPILLIAYNYDVRSEDYLNMKDKFRPGHADYTYQLKYGLRDWRGSGRASARETLARVAAGAIAKKFLKQKLGVDFLAYVEQVGNIITQFDPATATMTAVESNIIRCPDPAIAEQMIRLVEEVRDDGDSIGGIIRGTIKGLPVGLGDPVFEKLNSELGKAMLSINAVKGFDIGSGFAGVTMRGSQHNDAFEVQGGEVHTRTNHAGGTLGGISTGEMVSYRVAFKSVSTIKKQQQTIDLKFQPTTLEAAGRHDPCVLPRAVPIVEAMAALVVMDLYLRHKAQNLYPLPNRDVSPILNPPKTNDNNLASDVLERQFGPTSMDILHQDDSIRVICTKSQKDGQVLEVAGTTFIDAATKQFASAHSTVVGGRPIGKTFKELDIPFVRKIRLMHSQNLPAALYSYFGTAAATVMLVDLYVGSEETYYAQSLEIYNPQIHWDVQPPAASYETMAAASEKLRLVGAVLQNPQSNALYKATS